MKIIKIPYGEGGLGKTLGARDAPDKIVQELKSTYLTESSQSPDYSIDEVEVQKGDMSKTHDNILKKITMEGRAIIIGGDHSITYSAFKAFAKNNPGAGIIIFDAHADLDESTGIPTHEDYLRKLVEDNIIDPAKVILIGLRNFHAIEKRYMQDNKIIFYTCRHIESAGLESICDEVMAKAREWDHVYVSIDIDVLDPSHAPGTNHPEPAGLAARDLLRFIQRLKHIKKIGMADIVEVDPNIDLNRMTSRLAARLIKEMM